MEVEVPNLTKYYFKVVVGHFLIISILLFSIAAGYQTFSVLSTIDSWLYIPEHLLFAASLCISYLLFGLIYLVTSSLIFRLFFMSRWEGTRHKFDDRNVDYTYMSASLAIAEFLVLPFIRSTPFLNIYLRAMGAKIGKGTIITTTKINDPDIIEIGSNCIIGGESVLNGHSGEQDHLSRKKIIIRDNVTIGQYAVVMSGAKIESNTVIGAQSLARKYKTYGPDKSYIGVPA